MAVKLNQSGIQFNEIQIAAKTVGAVIAHSPYTHHGMFPASSDYAGTIDTSTPFINAIDINWNGAVLVKNGVTIRTSGDLLNQLENIYEKFGTYAPLESIEGFAQQITEATEKAEQALEAAQNAEQVNVDWNATEGIAAILNKPTIPTSLYDFSDWDDFATKNWVNNRIARFHSAYDIYAEQEQSNGRIPLSQEAWIESLHGKDGTNGKSAYELAVDNGLTNLTETEWIKSLKAKDGWSAYEIAVNNGFTGSEQEWLVSIKGEQGEQGKSNYDIYKDLKILAGEEYLTEEEWLTSLKGEKGDKGDQGEPGKDGNSVQIIGAFDTLQELYDEVEGKYYTLGSAYLVDGYLYIYNPSGLTIPDQWKNVGKIKGDQGPQGEQGEQGKSNYEIYRDLTILNGEEPLSELDWLETLRGPQGKSSYDIYVELTELAGEIPLSKENWLESLKGNIVYTAGTGIAISDANVISLDIENTWITINN